MKKISLSIIFLGVVLSIYIFNHTTPTGQYYSVNDMYKINISSYYACNAQFSDDPIYLVFFNKTIMKYDMKIYCTNSCKALSNVLHLNFTGHIATDELDNYVCLCDTSRLVDCKQNISEDVDEYYKYYKRQLVKNVVW